jgi:hypothetical protein
MPAYQNVTPPFSLSSGDVGFSFNNEAFPAANTAGSQFALPSFTGISDGGTAVRWQTIFGTAPTAVNIVLQGAMADVDSEYQTIDTSVATTGEARTIPNNNPATVSPALGTVHPRLPNLQTLATLAADKRSVTTPAQIIRELPQFLALPSPITMQPTAPTQSATSSSTSDNATPGTAGSPPSSTNSPNPNQQPQVVIPAEDLKPLYDFTFDCKACQTQLTPPKPT